MSISKLASQGSLPVRIEQRAEGGQWEIAFSVEAGPPCVLHWGMRLPQQAEWELPPRPSWPEGSQQAGHNAVQTSFPATKGERRVVIKLAAPVSYSALEFVLFYPEQGRWDNNGQRNYQVVLSATGAPAVSVAQIIREQLSSEKVVFERVFELENQRQLAVAVSKSDHRFRLVMVSDLPEPLVLHWGVARRSPYEWLLPPVALRPAATAITQNNAAQTPFTRQDQVNRLSLEFPEAEAPLGIPCVLKTESGRWIKDRRTNFYIPVQRSQLEGAPLPSGQLDALAQEITQAEQRNSWTLMHRFNLCFDLLDRVKNDREGLALLFVWLRFSAIRQLTWQRNFNTKPRELSHAQERLSQKLADCYGQESEGRPLLRLMLTTVGRGGEGQQIRDEILNIMHRHHLKEVAGHFLEEWHQKLHNNTTPDDIVICEAYLEFLRNNGNRDRFYETLRNGGVTKERLESFERPIRSAPDFVGHLKDGLIADFQNFLRILKAIHSGTDLETAINAVRNQCDGDTQNLLSFIWQHRTDPATPLIHFLKAITEARRRFSGRLNQPQNVRDLLYLDLALEQELRAAVERNVHLKLGREVWVELTTEVLANLNLSTADAELTVCSHHWERLVALPQFGQEWCLHARAVLDRIGRGLSRLIDQSYRLLQPKAERLGQAFQAESWAVTLFSEEVVRGNSFGFALSTTLNHLDPFLREGAHLGHWQLISRGHGWGEVEVVEALRSIQGKKFDSARVIIADQVMGDEEIPEGVTAVIAPDVTDVVSHVAVRARNSGLLFAACYDAELLQRLKSFRGRHLRLEISPGGDVLFEEAANDEPAAPAPEHSPLPSLVKPAFTAYAIAADAFSSANVGKKSLQLAMLRRQLPDWVHTPKSVAIPFTVFEKVLAWGQNSAIAGQYETLRRDIETDYARALAQLREVVMHLSAPPELADSLRAVLEKAVLPWPENWDAAWTCIKRVWASKWNDRAFLSRLARGIPHDHLYMAVLIQDVVPAEYAFVIHTANPATGNREELYAEVVLGLGETLVGNYPGRAFSFTSAKPSGNAILSAYAGKSIGLYGGGLIFRSDSNGEDLAGYAGAGLYDSVMLQPPRQVLLDYSQEPLIWNETFRRDLLRSITNLGVEVERLCGSAQDIEGAYAQGRTYLVQSRPQVGA
jgi:alpha-glucan,water dikinase